jgi:hypothetical protein
MAPDIQALLAWYGGLTPQTLARIGAFYRADAHFKDPFNDVVGIEPIRQVFVHMFATTETPRFIVRDVLADARRAFVTWDFDFGVRGRRYVVHGATRFAFDAQGLVSEHRDYWDVAEELWQKLPLLGVAVAWLRARFRTPVRVR